MEVTTTSSTASAAEFRALGSKISTAQAMRSVLSTTTRVGTKTPNYFRRKAAGEILPVNPLSEVSQVYSFSSGSMSAHHTRSTTWYSMAGVIPLFTSLNGKLPSWSSVPMPPGWDESLGNSMAITAIANARQELFDVLTFVAELEKTLDMLKGCIERYTTRLLIVEKHARVAWGTWKSGRLAPKSTLNFADFFASCWMEWRYGATPLMFDIDAMYKQLLELDALTHRVRGRFEHDPIDSNVVSTTTSGAGFTADGLSASGGWLWKVVKTSKQRVRPVAKCLVELTNSYRCTVDPMLTGYEMIPYSWMFDWFVNIGELIRTFSPFALGRVASSSISYYCEGVLSFTSVRPSNGAFVLLDTFEPSEFTLRNISHVRYEHNPEFGLTFRVEMSWRRILDLLALLTAKLAKTSRLIPQDAAGLNWRHLRV